MRSRKAGDQEAKPRYIALYHDEVDSMAYKTLSPNAVWLLVQIRRAWKGSNDRIELPFSRVSWRLKFGAFDKARTELVNAGFIRIVKQGGLLKNPNVYALANGWRGEVAKRLANDPDAGYTRNIRTKDGLKSVWYPARRGRKARATVKNLEKANAALRRRRARARKAKIPNLSERERRNETRTTA